jgi:polyhydroxyalkanoate synthesis regulator phasin
MHIRDGLSYSLSTDGPLDGLFETLERKGSAMLELLKKGLMAGIGAVVLTTEKVQESVRKLVEEGKITTDEGEKLVQELVKSGERQWEEASTKLTETAKKWSESAEAIKRKEFEELMERVESLERRMSKIEEGQTPKDEV